VSATPPSSPNAIEAWEVLDLLTALVQKSLVVYEEDEQGQGRYRDMRDIARALAILGEAAFAAAWAEGRALALEDAIQYALAEREPS
jgi:hypothetical protein